MLPLRTALLTALITVVSAQAAAPRDDVLRFVPSDIGFCVMVQNLRDTGKAFAASPFLAQLQAPGGKAAAINPELQRQLATLDDQVKKELGIGLDQLRDDILGDAVVFAYRPGPVNKPEQAQTLMLIRARNAETLEKLVNSYNDRQMKSRELLELQPCRYKDVAYVRRVEKRETNHYLLRGPVLVYAREEEMIQRAIDADLTAPGNSESWLGALFRQLGADKALLAVWINPRAFDAELAAKLGTMTKDEDPSAAVLKMFLEYWHALDGMCVSLTVDRDATIAIGVRGRTNALPRDDHAKKLFAELSRPSALWKQCPDEPLLAVSGRFDVAEFVGILDGFLSEKERTALRTDLNRTFVKLTGKSDVVSEVLPFLGPEWALFVSAPKDIKQLVPDGFFAVRVATGDPKAPVPQALLSQLEFLAKLACVQHSKPGKAMTLETQTSDKAKIYYLQSAAFAAAVRPGFGLKDGFIIVASSPDVIGAFVGPSPDKTEGPAPLLRVSFKAWHRYLKNRHEAFVQLYSERFNVAAEDAATHVDRLLTVLEFLDRMELRHEASEGQAIISLTLKTASPLRK
jgi:hypothetical protein